MRVVTPAGETIIIGTVETAPTIGIRDFSRIVTDDFGVTTIVERRFRRFMNVRVGLPFEAVDALQRRLAELRAASAQWIADDRFAWLKATGFYKDFTLDLAVPPLSYCNLSVEGLAEASSVMDAGEDPATASKVSSLQMLRPVIVTDGVLIASDVPENDAAAWSAGTTYPMGGRVIRSHRIYESLIGGNVGVDPTTDSAKWLDAGPTNRWAMFDQALGTSTTATSITVTLAAGTVNAVALLDVTGSTVRVQAGTFDQTIDVVDGAIVFDLPVSDAQVTVTIAGPSASVGTLLIGRRIGLGVTESSPTAGITDFSRKVEDDFGDVTVVERAWAKKMAAKTLIRTDAVDVVADRLASVRAQPVLWIAQPGVDSLTVYGLCREWSIEIGPTASKVSLTIAGLGKAAPLVPIGGGGSVAWPDITDPDGTKPTNNADKTSENTSKDTATIGGQPTGDFLIAYAAARARQDELENVTIPAVNRAVDDANGRIVAARARADGAFDEIANQVERIDERIDTISSSGGYDDTQVKASIETVRRTGVGNTEAIALLDQTLTASVRGVDDKYDAVTKRIERVAASDTQAVSERLDQLIAEGGGGSDGVDTVARSEIQRVERAYVAADVAFTETQTQLIASSRADATMMNGNANFSDWPDTRSVPNGWGLPSADATAAGPSVMTRAPGLLGKWAMKTSFAGGRANFFPAVSGLNFGDPYGGIDPGMFGGPGWYVMEADLTLDSGSLVGSGFYCASFNSNGVSIATGTGHFPDLSANGAAIPGAGLPGARYKFAMLLDFTDPNTRSFRFHPMVAWLGFPDGPAKVLRWHKAGVRPATPSEIAARRADTTATDALAKATAAESAIADLPNQYAAASTVRALDAQLRGAEPSGISTSLIARIEDRATAIADAKTGAVAQTVSTLRAEYDQTYGQVQQQAGVIAGVDGRTSVYWQVIGTTPDGKTAIRLSKQDGQRGVFYVDADMFLAGNLLVAGTVLAQSFNRFSMSRLGTASWTGSMTPAAGTRALVPWRLELPSIPPLGRFIYEFSAQVTSNAGQRDALTRNGKPYYINYVEAGGGLEAICLDPQGNGYRPRPNSSDPVLASADFVPLFQASIGNGNFDTGIIDEGDYYSRQVAATYTVTSINLRLTWVAI